MQGIKNWRLALGGPERIAKNGSCCYFRYARSVNDLKNSTIRRSFCQRALTVRRSPIGEVKLSSGKE